MRLVHLCSVYHLVLNFALFFLYWLKTVYKKYKYALGMVYLNLTLWSFYLL